MTPVSSRSGECTNICECVNGISFCSVAWAKGISEMLTLLDSNPMQAKKKQYYPASPSLVQFVRSLSHN
jgi:hypothetical protein